nr:hypothetical protein [Ectropis obliqua nucleopolyhedrovirus]
MFGARNVHRNLISINCVCVCVCVIKLTILSRLFLHNKKIGFKDCPYIQSKNSIRRLFY